MHRYTVSAQCFARSSVFTIRPPPRATLFPYTTLFRSTPLDKPAPPAPAGESPAFVKTIEDTLGAKGRFYKCWRFPRDRKSTRLNSSHRCISYAVFCLKKKKKTKKEQQHTSIELTYSRW